MSPRRRGGPRRLHLLDALPAHTIDQARADLTRALRRHERTPTGLRGEESGSHVPYRLSFDDHGILLDLLTDQADRRRRRWEAHRLAHGAPSTLIGGTGGAAVAPPVYEFGDVIAATWTQVAAFLDAPTQLHLFQTQSVAA